TSVVIFLSQAPLRSLHRASPEPERLGDLQDPHTLRKPLSHLPFGRAVYFRPGRAYAMSDGALSCAPLSSNGPISYSLPPLSGQRAGMPYRFGMGRPYGGNHGQAPE